MKSKKLFDYWCDEHGTFDSLAYDNKEEKSCPECGVLCSSIITPTRVWLDGTDPSFPTAWDKWAKVHEEKARQAQETD